MQCVQDHPCVSRLRVCVGLHRQGMQFRQLGGGALGDGAGLGLACLDVGGRWLFQAGQKAYLEGGLACLDVGGGALGDGFSRRVKRRTCVG